MPVCSWLQADILMDFALQLAASFHPLCSALIFFIASTLCHLETDYIFAKMAAAGMDITIQ